MRRSRRALGTAAWAAILVVVALAGVASVLVIENGGGVSQQSSNSSSSSTSMLATASTTSVNSPEKGLELSLALNASSLPTGKGIAATVVEMNTLATPNNVSAAADWPVGNLAVGPCGPLNYPVGIAVLRGNYAAGNVSSAKALQIYHPGVAACPMVLAGITSFEFQPSSDNATIFGGCQPGGACLSEIVDSTVSVNGYWNGGAFTSFPCGFYTVVAGDEWGGIAMIHFSVGCSG